MNTIINTGAVVSLYLSLFIITKKSKSSADKLLFLYFLINSFIFFISFLSYEYGYTDLQFFLINIELLLTPLWYGYIYRLVVKGDGKRGRVILHLIPYFLSLIYLCYLVVTISEYQFIKLIYLPFLKQPLILAIISIMELLVVPFYTVLAIRLLFIHRKSINKIFSYDKGVDLKWIKVFISLQLLGWLFLYIPYFTYGDTDMVLGLFLNGLLILYIGFFGIKQNRILNIEESIKKEKKYKNSSLNEKMLDSYRIRFLNYMESEKPYLDNELNIYKLSKAVDIPSHHLSQVLSSKINKSFYDFVNHYRVEEFKAVAKLDKYKNFTLLGVAMECGFNSKSSFNRIFKNITGTTPSQYLK